MRSFLAAAALLPLLTGCTGEQRSSTPVQQQAVLETAPPSQQMYALGTEVTRDGAVSARSAGDTFRRGGDVYLAVDVASASNDQRIVVEWQTDRGAVARRDVRYVPQTADYAAFSSGDTDLWPPGPYRVVVMIDGRKVTELPFQMM